MAEVVVGVGRTRVTDCSAKLLCDAVNPRSVQAEESALAKAAKVGGAQVISAQDTRPTRGSCHEHITSCQV